MTNDQPVPSAPPRSEWPTIAHINLARGFRGGERQTELLIRELAALGIRQRLVARRAEPLIVRLSDLDGLELRPVGGIVGATRALRGAGIAHVHEGRGIQAAALAKWLFDVRYIVTRRVTRPLKSNPLTRRFYRSADRLVGLSRSIAGQLADYVPAAPISVIPSAMTPMHADAERVRALRREFGPQPVIGHIGALVCRHKGQQTLIELARQRPDYTIVLVGSGADELALREASSDLDNVIFTGQVSDVEHYLAAFDVFAFPSRFEGLGSILLDAMAFGLPIAASNVSGIPDLIRHEENGLLIDLDDLDAWLAAVDRLVSDEALQQRFAERNRELIDDYTPQAMASRYLPLYADIVAAGAQ